MKRGLAVKGLSSDEESSGSDSNDSLPDITNLKAFDFEPICESRQIQLSTDENKSNVNGLRIMLSISK